MENNQENFNDAIARQELNLLFVVDNSGSMSGSNIASVNNAIRDVMAIMPEIQDETANVTIKINALIFNSDTNWVYSEPQTIENFKWNDVDTSGGTDFSKAYIELKKFLSKKCNGGQMPEYGGIAPIILFMTDGEPTSIDWKERLAELKLKGWFGNSIRYALAIGEVTPNAVNNLVEFTGNPETVLRVHTAEALRKVIQVIAVSASKVRSKGTTKSNNQQLTTNDIAIQTTNNEIKEIDGVKDVTEDWN